VPRARGAVAQILCRWLWLAKAKKNSASYYHVSGGIVAELDDSIRSQKVIIYRRGTLGVADG
jgi:hypothetical protein